MFKRNTSKSASRSPKGKKMISNDENMDSPIQVYRDNSENRRVFAPMLNQATDSRSSGENLEKVVNQVNLASNITQSFNLNRYESFTDQNMKLSAKKQFMQTPSLGQLHIGSQYQDLIENQRGSTASQMTKFSKDHQDRETSSACTASFKGLITAKILEQPKIEPMVINEESTEL